MINSPSLVLSRRDGEGVFLPLQEFLKPLHPQKQDPSHHSSSCSNFDLGTPIFSNIKDVGILAEKNEDVFQED